MKSSYHADDCREHCRRGPRRERRAAAAARRSLAVAVSLYYSRVVGKGPAAQSTDEEYASRQPSFSISRNWWIGLRKRRQGQSNSLFLCTIGDDPFQGALESTVAGKAIGNRVVRIRHLGRGEDMQACQILFLGKAQSKRIPMLLTNLHNAPVLTVGESPGFLGAGGMI